MFAEDPKQSTRELQWLALGVLLGMLILLGKLWHTQVVARKRYEQSLQVQSVRTVPLLPTRGRILDVRGRQLAENEPRYDVKLYLEDIRPLFYHEYTNTVRPSYLATNPGVKLSRSVQFALQAEARYRVASNLVARATAAVGSPLILNKDRFGEHYTNKLSLPLTVLTNLTRAQISGFIEKAADFPGVALEATPVRVYPYPGIASHLIGYIGRAEIRGTGEEFQFSYPVQGFVGRNGLEQAFDSVLRGTPGVKALLVNNIGYAQSESRQQEPEPGWDLHLTLDVDIQKAADQALRMTGPETRGAAVVMDVRNGDIIAMASSPTFDLNDFVDGVSHAQWAELTDPKTLPLFDRAAQGMYPPGSVYKIITGLAALEAGLDPKALYESAGYTRIGRRIIQDTAKAGIFDFRRAFAKSSNPYFIDAGRRIGKERILALSKEFKLGERTGYLSRTDIRDSLEKPGYLPNPLTGLKRDGLPWQEGDTANLSIGQGEILTTPLQVAVMMATVANRGTIYTPRLITAIRPPEKDATGAAGEFFEPGILRGRVNLSPASWQTLHEAMLADVEDPEGTGKSARIEGYRIGGKTGTAELDQPTKAGDRKITWFAAYGPFENPRYAVVVMQEGGASGGGSCAPRAREIFKALIKRDTNPPPQAERTLTFQREAR
ncbi:MAG TPA: penicillin-binding protein 2 [Methylomirabilota bacterium]|nr:penicillin-binding protein 2 [Methylomirabilota bacterium]